MKITIKTLKQQIYQIEMKESDTVQELKKKLEVLSNNILPAHRMNLIYSGLILEDEKRLAQYNIDEKKFLVVMIRPENNNFNNSSISMTSQDVQNIPQTNINSSFQCDSERPINEEQQNPSNDSNTVFETSGSITDPTEIEQTILNIMNALRFSRDEVERALHVSFNNPDRAVEYLLNGNYADSVQNQIESNLTHQQLMPTEVQQYNDGQQNCTSSPLNFLRNDPQFQQMRMILQQNPDMIDFFMQRIGESNVALLDLIRQNQEDFIELINEPICYDNDNTTNENNQSYGVTISVNDWNAITRLMELGFSENECAEAYLACEKNEEIAANYLLSRDDDLNRN